MASHLLVSLTQAMLVCLMGGFVGWRYALRNVPRGARPPASSQLKAALLACALGTLVCLVFEAWLIAAYPLAPNPQLVLVQFLAGVAIAKFVARHDLKGQPSQP